MHLLQKFSRIWNKIFISRSWHYSKSLIILIFFCISNVNSLRPGDTLMYQCSWVNSLRPSDAIWCHITWSPLVQEMAWCRMAPSQYLNQCWLIVSVVFWHPHEGDFTASAPDIYPRFEFEYYQFKITATSIRGRHVNMGPDSGVFIATYQYLNTSWLDYWQNVFQCLVSRYVPDVKP